MIRPLAPARGLALLCCLALAGVSLAVPMSSPAAAAPGTVLIERDPTSQRVEFVRAAGKSGDLNPGLAGRSASASADKSDDWLDEQAGLFGISPDELVLAGNEASDAGRTLTYTQEHDGVPVLGAALKVNLDTAGALTSVNGHVVPGLDLTIRPGISADKAEAAAIRMVRQDPPTDEDGRPAPTEGAAADSTLVVYETGSTLGQSGIPYLAWQIEVTAGQSVREQVILDAHQLKPLNRWSDGHTALSRKLRTVTSDSGTIDDYRDDVLADVWAEGESTAALSPKRQDLMETTSESYWMFRNIAGRDSYDDQGSEMVLVDNRRDECPNASWMGTYTSYCPGVDSDDIVAHEWGHAYTEHTSGLIYQWQAGALNESYSDVWGETVDLLNSREDEGESIAASRADSSCTRNTDGARFATLTIDEPVSIAGPCVGTAKAATGPALPDEPQTVRVVVGSTTNGCTTLTNTAAIAGNWVYVDRGTCSFAIKADNIAAAGGVGMLVSSGSTSTVPFAADGNGTLPHLMIPQAKGDAIKSISPATPIMVTLSGSSPTGTETHRWLVGEKATAMPSALRDMWNPNCVGDPAKVTDAEYYCGTGDSGGVHFNSGVPNRAYSLAVDGGTFNGQTVTGIGIDQAAQIWWRAGASYLTPSSDFNDFASSLAESCTTLVGQPITKLSLTSTPGIAATPVTASDCGELDKVIAATELRTDVVERCAAAPRFTAGEPAGCGAGTTKVTVLKQDFENGLGNWSGSTSPAGGTASPGPSSWTTTSRLPNSSGSAAYVANPYGNCGTDSVAGVSSLTSPAVTVASDLAPRLTFRHAVSLEKDYDGANVKISVNGGAFTVIPEAAYTQNGLDSTLTNEPSGPSEGNPMAAERVWSGAETHTLGARWGTSQVDLEAAGVGAGDSVRFRFDLGTDLCAGAGGWYVDDISVTYCAITTTVAATAPTSWVAGSGAQMPVAVSAASSLATGDVVARTASGSTLGTATLVNGTATLGLPGSVPAGTHQLTVVYRGTASHAPAEAHVLVTVNAPQPVTPTPAKATSKTTVKVSPTKPRRGKTFTLRATVKSSTTATGRVAFKLNGKSIGTATLKGGRATLRVSAKKAKKLKVSSRKSNAISVAYAGSTKVARSSTTVKVRARR